MGMTIDNLCKSYINLGCEFQSGIVRTECAFYMPPYIESDNCGNYVVMKPTVEVIPKDQYEARLKADLKAILVELQLEIEECIEDTENYSDYNAGLRQGIYAIQERINSLKENTDE